MNKRESENSDKNNAPRKLLRPATPPAWILLILTVVTIFLWFLPKQQLSRISYQQFREELLAKNIGAPVEIIGQTVKGKFKEPPDARPASTTSAKNQEPKKLEKSFYFNLPETERALDDVRQLLIENNIEYLVSPETDNSLWFSILVYAGLSILLVALFFLMLRRTRDQIMGGGFLSGFSKSPAKEYQDSDEPITFKDVAGLDSVKGDLQEIIEFLKDPVRFQRLGGRVPKGVLLMGPPGTGKTLLARAVAGEAGVPFYSVNGSEFIQMFVGVGASRVRDLFQKAKEHAPSMIFIDEIDAVGRQRGAGLGGGHDEREQTLNQILSEMDGFDPASSVIVIAATNRPDVLDPALLRPGRFDRHITVDRPTLRGRIEMFKVHVRNVPLAEDVDIEQLAKGSVGLTGADIRNLVNEAALWATRHDKKAVEMDDFEYARDKILMGPKREEMLVGKEKEKTAYHEAGHALIAWLTEGTSRVHKVTVIPRGRALGLTISLPDEDKMNVSESELQDRLAMLLGGRAAEKIVYHEFSVGAQNDLEQATNLARNMVTKWGMSEALGPVSYKLSDDDPFLGREIHQSRHFSEATLQKIDAEVAGILHDASNQATQVLNQHRDKLDKIAQALVDEEELSENQITQLIGPSVHALRNRSQEADAAKVAEEVA